MKELFWLYEACQHYRCQERADERVLTFALHRLQRLASHWQEVDPGDAIRETAVPFVRVHPLRACDALQLAAAYVAAEQRPSSLAFVTLDERLAGAARKEGFAALGLFGAQ